VSFPAYTSYKDSEVEWLGPVPSHWSPTRLRFLTELNPSKSEVSDLSPDTEVSFVPMEAIGESGDLSREQTRPLSDVLTGYTYFREGDVSIAKITPCFENGKGAIMRGLSAGVGFGTTELIIARPRPDATTPEFLNWLFRSPAFRTRGEAAMYGAGGQKRVPEDFVRDFVSPGAPLSEQVAIAAFLDRETAKIDALIKEQRRLITLLKEKRQAVISHAVTMGLDPHVPMKDSGSRWLGEVPAHWVTMPLMRLTAPGRDIMYGIVLPGPDVGAGGVPIVKGGDVKPHRLRLSLLNRTTTEIEAPFARARLKPNDIVYSIRGSIGDAEPVPLDLEGANITQDVARVSARDGVNFRWLLYVMKSKPIFVQLEQRSLGAAVRGINIFDLKRACVPVPPSAEQAVIADHLDSETLRIDDLSGAAEAGIKLLRERRVALISAAVTGKIDVRGSAKVLPFPIDRTRARALVGTEIIERSAGQPTFGRVKFQKMAFLAEGHVGIGELAGCYTRAAAGPLDSALIDDMERGAHSMAGVTVDQAGGTGTAVSYRLGQQRGAHREELADCLGPDRTAKLDKLIADFAPLSTKQAEAVATLYSVWNDLLREGATPSDDEIITGFLNDWHPEKRAKFSASDLPEWLGWMRRHGIVPTGSGPKTTTGRLFV
jgi:type I restriction enzyme S subunit